MARDDWWGEKRIPQINDRIGRIEQSDRSLQSLSLLLS